MLCELPLTGAPQGQCNWWTKDLGREQKDPQELDWSLDNSKEWGSGREKSETNPSTHPLPYHRKEDQQNWRDGLKPAEDFLFLFLLPSILYFFIPSSCLLLFIFYFNFCYNSFFLSLLSSFFIPSFLSFSISFHSFPSPFFFFFLFFSPFHTGETIKPAALKTPELDPNRAHPNNQDSDTNSLCYYRDLARWELWTPVHLLEEETHQQITTEKGEEGSGSHINLNPGLIWKYN